MDARNELGMVHESLQGTENKDNMEEVAMSHLFTDSKSGQEKKRKCKLLDLPVRVQIGILAFFMFFVTQMIRSNLYIARISMLATENSTTQNCSNLESKLNWNEEELGIVLSAFYWAYWMTELPGGMLAERLGGRRVLGVSVLTAGVLNLVFPIACNIHFSFAAVVRAVQGLCLGTTWPAMHAISAHWIPTTERSKFMTSYHGAAVSTALTYPLCGYLMSVLDWPSVFYMTGILTIMWCAAWFTIAYDRPSLHPHITSMEKKYLEETVGSTVSTHKRSPKQTPWKAILCSAPFWAVLLASQGLMWGNITLSMQLPAYFKHVHLLDYKMNGFVSGIPELCKFIFSLGFSMMIDHSLRKKHLTITEARKLAVATSEFLPAILLVLLAVFETKNTTLSVVTLALASATGGASSSGSLANIVDLSPNYAGTLLGLVKTLTVVPGVLSPILVSMLYNIYGSVECWHYVFLIMAGIYAVCGAFFMLLGSGDVQVWNQENFKELRPVNTGEEENNVS